MDSALDRLHAMTPQGLSNIAYAMASLGHADFRLFERLAAMPAQELAAFDVQALSNLAWSLATLGCRNMELLDRIVREGLRRAHHMLPQHLSNVLWALATLGYQDAAVVSAYVQHVTARLSEFSPQGLSNTAWALAKLSSIGFQASNQQPLTGRDSDGRVYQELYRRIADAAVPKIAEFSTQGLANLIWAFASAGCYHEALMSAASQQLQRSASSLNPQHCSVAAWSFATLRHHDQPLFESLLELVAAELQRADAAAVQPQTVANLLWAAARVGQPLGHSSKVFVRAALRLLPKMPQQELCNTFWALGALQLLDWTTFEQFSRQLGRLLKHLQAEAGALPGEALQQVYHAQLMAHSLLQRGGKGKLLEPGSESAHERPSASAVSAAEASTADRCRSGLDAGACPWTFDRHFSDCRCRECNVSACSSADDSHLEQSSGCQMPDHVKLRDEPSPVELSTTSSSSSSSRSSRSRSLGDASGAATSSSELCSDDGRNALLPSNADITTSCSSSDDQDCSGSQSSVHDACLALPMLLEPLQARAQQQWLSTAGNVRISGFQRDVSSALSLAGLPHALEWMTDDGHFSIDIGFQVNESPIALEVDGAHHYSANR